jgi:hypothetical protein
MKIQKCYCCEKDSTWLYMAGKGFEEDCYCEEHVPKGCSCNNFGFDIYDYHTEEEKQSNFKNFKEDILNRISERRKFYALNYGMQMKCSGEHLEEIRDINLIKQLINNLTMEQLTHYIFTPLDNNGNEYPCCEYWHYPEGVDNHEEDYDNAKN